MATVTLAPHVQSFDAPGYKRTLTSNAAVSLPSKRLAVPTGDNKKAAPFPATTARPDQRVNVRVPVARACFSRLLPGQVAFVNRHFGKGHVGAATGPGGLTPVVSLEELNDMLSIPDNHITRPLVSLFRPVQARSIYVPDGAGVLRRARFNVFDDRVGKQTNKKPPVPDSQHPIHQFALDGLVATRVEEVDDLNTSSTAYAQQVCTVAVKGHASMRLSQVPGDVFRGVYESNGLSRRAAPNVFLEPARILAKVYVVLVAIQVDDVGRRWMLQYETVSSSNLDVDPLFASSVPLFRTEMNNSLDDISTIKKGRKFVLRAMELGTIVDTRFGPSEQPQLIVCVHVVPFEPTKLDGVLVPKDVWETFVPPTDPKTAKSGSVSLKPNAGLRRLQNGLRPTVTGVSTADVAALKQSISDMMVQIAALTAQVQAAEQKEAGAIADLKKDVARAANKQAQDMASVESQIQVASDRVDILVDEAKQNAQENKNSVRDMDVKIQQLLAKVDSQSDDTAQIRLAIVQFLENRGDTTKETLQKLQVYIDEVVHGTSPPGNLNQEETNILQFAEEIVAQFGIEANDTLV
jgi:hypothetical protein